MQTCAQPAREVRDVRAQRHVADAKRIEAAGTRQRCQPGLELGGLREVCAGGFMGRGQYNCRPMNRPTAIYSAAQVRALDAYEIEKRRVPGFTLMTRAAEAALTLLRARWPQRRRVAVVCGAGNNGGDGYVLARLAQAAGLEVLVLAARPRTGSLAMRGVRRRNGWRPAGARIRSRPTHFPAAT